MSRGGFRAAVAVFLIGLLFVWLVRPIGDACPDVDKLPTGSDASSMPSFAPPLTRTCTYSTPDGTQARTRYLPVIDLVALLFAAGVVGAAIGVAGRGRGRGRGRARGRGEGWSAEREPAPRREQRGRAAPPAAVREGQSRGERDAAQSEGDVVRRGRERAGARRERAGAQRERDALERERARREREARRGR